MPITTSKGGTADASDIVAFEITRKPDGNLLVDVHYKGGSLTKWENSAAFKAKIEETYPEVLAAINAQEGLS
ncbi:MAG: hypothetical protein GWN58_33140 [Anaerolineae bacterium]|nr:hypothetical protein [Thermoplasmata archaeon]NIV34121.1 hypothetical protein [Anaerolineae bacterium]NIY05972.1 hypothetical protein [Thermoplasmata archaeon]